MSDLKELRYGASAPLSFVTHLFEYFAVLTCGGCSHILSEEVRKDLQLMTDYYEKHQLTCGFISPRMLKFYHNKDTALKRILTGSEKVSGLFSDRFEIVNIYGQSEAMHLSSFPIDKPCASTPIGKAAPGVSLFLLDEDGRETAPDAEGEICARGIFPSSYLNLPEQSARTFKKAEDGLTVIHTGDIGRLLSDGNFVYINRRDWMVKINGQRVEPGEIETAMKTIPGIENAAVRDFTDRSGRICLCGYYTASRELDEKKILALLASRLPSYMIPSCLIRLDALPLNVNGKLDRKALIPPDTSASRAEYKTPANKTEQQICTAFEQVLGVKDVGARDDFFLLGGDSIKVMELQNACSLNGLSTGVIYEAKTPEKMAEALEENKTDLFGEAMAEKRVLYPLTSSQMGIYLACLRNPKGTMYNIPLALHFQKNGIDLPRLLDAIRKAAANHAALNCVLAEDRGIPVMKPAGNEVPILSFKTDNADLSAAEKAFVRPFDLLGAPLYRFACFETETLYSIVLDFHHLIFDGTSSAVFGRDIAQTYDGKELLPEEMTMFGLGILEEKLPGTEEYQAAAAYYASVLSGTDNKAEIMEDFSENPAVQDKPCGRIVLEERGSLAPEKAEIFSARCGVTENTFFLSAYLYAISKYAGQKEVLSCFASHGRHDSRMKNTVGMMVRTLPLYVSLDERISVGEFLTNMQDSVQLAIAHDSYPFVKLAEEYEISPDYMFVYQADTLNSVTVGGMEAELNPVPVDSALSKISLMVFRKNGAYVFRLEYRSDLYTEENIRAFSELYLRVLNEFLRADRLCEISLADKAHLDQLESFHGRSSAFERNESMVSLFRRQAAGAPERTAVVCLDKTFTYAQTDEISERIAGCLKSRGIGSGDVVSVLIPRSEYMVLASLGVLKAGAAYQPLDPSYPPERLDFMMEDSAAKLLIADESQLGCVPHYHGETLLLKDIPSLPSCGKMTEDPKPEDLFILLYTSGTTGKPKGVMLEHGNLTAFCSWYRSYYALEPENRVAAYASYGFDACMMDLWPALTSGAAVYIIAESIRFDLVALNEYFEKNRITHSFITTQVGRVFATTMENHSLKHLSVGGEILVPLEPPAGFGFYNCYGPTECTIITTAFKIDRFYNRVPIGRALDNVRLYITDSFGRRLPAGATGELCISGPQVGRGYLNRPEQKAFSSNPYCSDPDCGRLYHTGDLTRFLPDGNVDFIGRHDGQVKIRGFRIELSEVEKVIREFDGIRDATVVAVDEPGGGKSIAAYVVSDAKVDNAAMNAFIASRKPPYMVPAAAMQIDQIPLNINQKVDRRKLPKIELAGSVEPAETERPMNDLETRICAIVADIIGSSRFGVATNLLNAGLTSLSVIRLAVSLNQEFGYEADSKKMMQACSVLSIENELLHFLMNRPQKPETAQGVRKTYRETYPLSSAQFGVYSEYMKDPFSTRYCIAFCYLFPKDTDPEKLAENVRTILAAHPYIFTCLTLQNDDVEQLYAGSIHPEVPVYHIDEVTLEKISRNLPSPFDLMKPYLFRIGIAATEKAVYLVGNFHHILFDGTSLSIFTKQLKEVCEGGTLLPETYNYYDYVDDEIAGRSSPKYTEAEAFFDRMLSQCEAATELSADLEKPAAGETGAAPVAGPMGEVFVPTDFTAAQDFCTKLGVTPAHLYLAATFYVISRFTDTRDVYLSTISSGRSNLKLFESFGMFVKTIPVAGHIGDLTGRNFIRQVRDMFLGATENEQYPYSEVCRKYGYAPNIVYEYQIGVTEKLFIHGTEIKCEPLPLKEAKFRLAIHIEERGDKPCIVIQYDSSLYSTALMKTLASSVENAMRAMIARPDGNIRSISLLTEEQLRQVEAFASTDLTPSKDVLMQDGFERQVRENPDHTALIACDQTLTYGEPDRLANTVANALIEKGFTPGSRALLLLPRTSKVMIAILGILKAGGAYIPAVSEYPAERIQSIFADCGAQFILCEGALTDLYPCSLDIDNLLARGNSSRPNVKIAPEDLAYLIYTSGSTGKPKGVMLRHRGIANYVTDAEANLQVHAVTKAGHVYGSVTTVSFDMALKEIWVSLSNGLTLAFGSEEQARDPAALAAFMKANHVDVFNATPSRLLQYLEVDEFAQAIADCRVILSGWESYPENLLIRLRAITNARILNTYGPTEITVSSNAKDLTNAETVTIGRPLLGCREYILDSDGNRLPAGVPGELVIAGCGVAAGYNRLPEQTANAFFVFEGYRAYRSGDYAKWTPQGEVMVLGRKDGQVKIRGLRIELGEIEACLSEIEGIRSCTAVIRKLGSENAVCAYYTADRALDPEFLRQALKKKLPDYMVPASFNLLARMPLTVNGKINAKALPEPAAALRGKGQEPITDNEKLFCRIFAEVLRLDKVYADDSFFEIGGNSLTVTRIIIAANKQNINIAYGDVFQHPTPGELAAFVAGPEEPDGFMDLSHYDYRAIDFLLADNTLDSFRHGKMQEPGTVLLTGTAGYLGAHVLHEYLHSHTGKIFCLLRGKHTLNASKRLYDVFFYYFNEDLVTDYPDRVIILEGDITDPKAFEQLSGQGINTVINCAANVKHFSNGTDIEDVDYYGVLNLIGFCKSEGCRLIQTSTMSIGGLFLDAPGGNMELRETQLFFGQKQLSKYTQAKFMAERAILEEVSKGFNAKIMRLGNLAPRDCDGEYQMNYASNNFMRRLKSSVLIGAYPYSAANVPFELSPIDSVARAVLLLSGTPKACTVFHPYNNHLPLMDDLYTEMKKLEISLKGTESSEYQTALLTAEENPEKAKVLSGFLAYENAAHGQETFYVGKNNSYTIQVLYRLGFSWPVTSENYMRRFLNALNGLGFFDL